MKRFIKILPVFLVIMALGFSAKSQFYRPFPPYRNSWDQNNRVSRDGEIHRNNEQRYSNARPGNSKLNFTLNYAMAQPLGSLKDYTDHFSFRGFRGSLLYEIAPTWQIGLSSGAQNFYQKLPRAVYHTGGNDISAVKTNTFQLIPIQATALKFLSGEDSKLKTYAGLGLGIAAISKKDYWGQFLEKHTGAAFSASPVIGIRLPFSKTSPLQLNADARYNYAAYSKEDFHSVNSLELNVGLSIHIR